MTKPMTLVEYKEQATIHLKRGALLRIHDIEEDEKYLAILAAIPNICEYGLICITNGCYWGCSVGEDLPSIHELEKRMGEEYVIELIYDDCIENAMGEILGINSK